MQALSFATHPEKTDSGADYMCTLSTSDDGPLKQSYGSFISITLNVHLRKRTTCLVHMRAID